ncbi:MAG: 3-keto-5-aminohexanoate cleavage protein [Alphaproteobacteria bacterium]|nr:3-keto-5-aminohexanoate cleavage protein [Alphaproteobacteria bacterium]
MIQACLNGGRTKKEVAQVPITPIELAADAQAVRAAGAGALHLHPRNAAGAESLAPDDVARVLEAVRTAVPDMPVGIGTGAWIAPGGRARQALIDGWTVLPDYASVNLVEDDAPEVIEILLSKGIGVEAGLWTAADAERLVATGLGPRCLRVLMEMMSPDGEEAVRECGAAVAVLRSAGIDRPFLVHGQDSSQWPMVAYARERGFDARVGFEDGLLLPDGRPAPSNAALVRAAVEILG